MWFNQKLIDLLKSHPSFVDGEGEGGVVGDVVKSKSTLKAKTTIESYQVFTLNSFLESPFYTLFLSLYIISVNKFVVTVEPNFYIKT